MPKLVTLHVLCFELHLALLLFSFFCEDDLFPLVVWNLISARDFRDEMGCVPGAIKMQHGVVELGHFFFYFFFFSFLASPHQSLSAFVSGFHSL